MKIEVTEKDLDNLTGMIKLFGVSYFKEISGQQCLAHINLMNGLIDIANRILKEKEVKQEVKEEIKEEIKEKKNNANKRLK